MADIVQQLLKSLSTIDMWQLRVNVYDKLLRYDIILVQNNN
jgi:hypothetical protein